MLILMLILTLTLVRMLILMRMLIRMLMRMLMMLMLILMPIRILLRMLMQMLVPMPILILIRTAGGARGAVQPHDGQLQRAARWGGRPVRREAARAQGGAAAAAL